MGMPQGYHLFYYMKTIIQKQLDLLKNKKCFKVGFIKGSMFNIDLGNPQTIKGLHGKSHIVGQYSIALECAHWTLEQTGKVLGSSHDNETIMVDSMNKLINETLTNISINEEGKTSYFTFSSNITLKTNDSGAENCEHWNLLTPEYFVTFGPGDSLELTKRNK